MAERVTRYTPEQMEADAAYAEAFHSNALHRIADELRQAAETERQRVTPSIDALTAVSLRAERVERIVAGMREWLRAERLSWQKEAASGGREYRERAASNRDTCARMLAELARLEREP